jgi:acyl carrier protein
MNNQSFIDNIFDQFESTEREKITLETIFRELDEWDSLTALGVLSMIKIKYGVTITAEKLKSMNTLKEIFDYINDIT